MNFLRLFCHHIWKETTSQYLYWRREKDGGTGLFGLPTYSNFEYRAVTEKCVKCDYSRIMKHRISWGREIPSVVDVQIES